MNSDYIQGYIKCLSDFERLMCGILEDLTIHKIKFTPSVIHQVFLTLTEWSGTLRNSVDTWVRVYEKGDDIKWQLVSGYRKDLLVLKEKPLELAQKKRR